MGEYVGPIRQGQKHGDKYRQFQAGAQRQSAEHRRVVSLDDQETTEATGVSRQTVNGWKNHHPAFVTALTARRTEVWGVACDRLRALLPKALDALEGSILG